jgi:hypothetical protein
MFHWRFDEQHQTLHAPSGLVISVREIAHWVQDRVYNRHDLTGPWAGFRVRGRWMTGPGVRITPESLRHLVQGADSPGER